MKIGAINTLNSNMSNVSNNVSSADSGFAQILGSVQNNQKIQVVEKNKGENSSGLNNNMLLKLLKFLKSSSSELNADNTDILTESKNENLGVSNDLQFTDQEIISSLVGLLGNFNINDAKVSEDLKNLIKEIPAMSPDDALVSLSQFLPFLNIDQLDFTKEETAQMVKSLKMVDLVLESKGVPNPNLKELLQKISIKLETEVKNNTQVNKNEYLKTIFAPITKKVDSNPLKQSKVDNDKTTITGDLTLPRIVKMDQITMLQNQPKRQVSTEQLIKQFESILSKSQFVNSGGNQKLFIRLNPDHLGTLRIELIQKDAVLTAKLMTTTGAAKDLLESQIQSLKQAFTNQNIQIDKIEVTQQFDQQESFIRRDPQQQQQQQQQNEENKDQQNSIQDSNFGLSFEDALLNVEV